MVNESKFDASYAIDLLSFCEGQGVMAIVDGNEDIAYFYDNSENKYTTSKELYEVGADVFDILPDDDDDERISVDKRELYDEVMMDANGDGFKEFAIKWNDLEKRTDDEQVYKTKGCAPIHGNFNETSRRQKAKHAFLGHMNNIRNFGIFSPENPMGKRLSNEENKELRARFERVLNDGHYVYFKTKGRYGNDEKSYIVYNVSLVTLKTWGGKDMFNQESFLFCETNYDEEKRKTSVTFNFYLKEDENKLFKLIESVNEFVDFSGREDNFTAIGRNFKFNIPLKFFSNANMIYESARSERPDEFDHMLERSMGCGMASLYYRDGVGKYFSSRQ